MSKYSPDHCRIFNAGDDVHGSTNAAGAGMRRSGNPGITTALNAGFSINIKYALKNNYSSIWVDYQRP